MDFRPTNSAIFNQVYKTKKADVKQAFSLIDSPKTREEYVVKLNNYADAINIISRQYKSYINRKTILEDLREVQKFILIDARELDIPSWLNYILVPVSNHQNNVVVFLKKQCWDGDFVNPKKLFEFLQNAEVTDTLAHINDLMDHSNLLINGTQAYVGLMMRIFDRLYSVRTKDNYVLLTSYLLAKFYINTMNRIPWDNSAQEIAFKAIGVKGSSSERTWLLRLDESFINENPNAFKDIFSFIEGLQSIPFLAKANINKIVNVFATTYGETQLLAIDYLPAFWQLLLSAEISSVIVKSKAVKQNAPKATTKFYDEFAKLIN